MDLYTALADLGITYEKVEHELDLLNIQTMSMDF